MRHASVQSTNVHKPEQHNHKKFFDRLAKRLGYYSLDDWYNITLEDIQRYGGAIRIHDYFNNSPSKALLTVYPEHNWMPWKFRMSPRGFWEKSEHHLQFFNWLGEQLGYHSLDDWYNVTQEDIHRHG